MSVGDRAVGVGASTCFPCVRARAQSWALGSTSGIVTRPHLWAPCALHTPRPHLRGNSAPGLPSVCCFLSRCRKTAFSLFLTRVHLSQRAAVTWASACDAPCPSPLSMAGALHTFSPGWLPPSASPAAVTPCHQTLVCLRPRTVSLTSRADPRPRELWSHTSALPQSQEVVQSGGAPWAAPEVTC